MLRIRGLILAMLVGAALVAAPGGAGAAVVNNGDFETGSLSGWQHADSPDSASGSWYAYTGTTSPTSGAFIAAPPQGSWAAVTDQFGPGRRILYQDVTVPSAGIVQLSSFVYYTLSEMTSFVSQPNLDYTGPDNEQYRFDVMRPGAAIDSVSSGDVLATLFQTATGDPRTLAPTRRTLDLSALAGQSVRIRLAEVDNIGNLWASADAVAINGLTLGKAKPNRKKGIAKLPVTVTDPGAVSVSGKGVKTKTVTTQAGTAKLKVKPKGKTKRKLNESGKAKVKVTVTYTPTGGTPLTATAKAKLKKGT